MLEDFDPRISDRDHTCGCVSFGSVVLLVRH